MNALAISMVKILAAMALGFFLRKINMLTDAAAKSISALIINVTAPCLLFGSIISMDGSEFKNAVTLLWVGVVVYLVLILLAILITKLLKVETSAKGVYQAALIFGNVSFLGIPLVESLYGATGVFYIAVLNIHFNLVFFTYGFYLIMNSGNGEKKFTAKKIINSGMISIAIAMILFFLQIRLPELVLAPISFIGSITSPLSMVIIGSSAAAYSLKTVFSKKKIYIMSAIRLLAYPIIAYFIFKMTLGDNLITNVLCIYIGMPTASVVGMTAIAYDADAESGTSCSAMTTILSLITIPIIYTVMSYL